ncbi:DUF5009 domain-containing protein [Echinicola shivajiensis]|uniref:DUF5009 domain-containing protein n=1 Tax=Echinicola shivajiensis TaxID=1035916 RepID=UPI001BFC95C0|nr:DUF5009 domain-containing protein [Echinicola shivajiensis]
MDGSSIIIQRPEKENDTSSAIPHIGRSYAIDVFRAFTMFLMIFVNDLWSLAGYPAWIGHAAFGEDRLGFSDVVFPAFLVIMGLSIPFAIQSRLKKGASTISTIGHIFIRSAALLIMGIFHVNLESYSDGAVLPKPVWQILITIGFFMIWLDFPKHLAKSKKYVIQATGILLLTVMAYVYEGGTVENPEWMRTQWYGILGLIGWAYMICAIIYVVTKGASAWQIIAFVFFFTFNSFNELGWLNFLTPMKEYIWIVGNGAMPAFTMAGVIISLSYRKWFLKGNHKHFWLLSFAFSALMLVYGIVTRPIWGIHKIGDSPSWLSICIAISVAGFAFFVWLIDIKKQMKWFNIIKPAGTSTLTCYLLPYIHYAIYTIIGISLPLVLRSGVLGIIKCLLYSIVIIVIAGVLEKLRLRLKL